jgi:hypothetical protein
MFNAQSWTVTLSSKETVGIGFVQGRLFNVIVAEILRNVRLVEFKYAELFVMFRFEYLTVMLLGIVKLVTKFIEPLPNRKVVLVMLLPVSFPALPPVLNQAFDATVVSKNVVLKKLLFCALFWNVIPTLVEFKILSIKVLFQEPVVSSIACVEAFMIFPTKKLDEELAPRLSPVTQLSNMFWLTFEYALPYNPPLSPPVPDDNLMQTFDILFIVLLTIVKFLAPPSEAIPTCVLKMELL